MPTVYLLSGSPKPEGNTMTVLAACAEAIRAAGVETALESLAGRKIESCVACGRCAAGKRCVLDDDFAPILEAVRKADGFVVGAPVYFGTARADLMAVLQRVGMVSRSTDRFLARKVGGPVAVARRGGHTASIQEMLMFYLINDMIVPGSTYWNIVFGRTPGEAREDREGMETVRRFGENVGWLVKKLAGGRKA